MKKLIYLLACLLAFSLALATFASCGVNSEDPENSSKSATGEATTPNSDETDTTVTTDDGSNMSEEVTTAQDYKLGDETPSDGSGDYDYDQNWTDNY